MKKVIKIEGSNQNLKNAILPNTFDNTKPILLKSINQDYAANIFEHIPRTSTFSKHLKQQLNTDNPHNLLQQPEKKETQQAPSTKKNNRRHLNLPLCSKDMKWPLFRISTDVTIKRFWNKRTPQDQNKQWQFDDYLFQSIMLRIGRKKKNSKGYYYKLTYSGLLMYFKKESDTLPKGFLELSYNNRVIISHQRNKRNESLPILYIERTEGVGITIFDSQNEQTLALSEALSEFCLMKGFDNIYTDSDELGSGAFATVFKVQRKRDQQIFAAKTIYKSIFEENKHKEKFIQMVYNEVIALKSLEHSGIEKIYEIYQEKDRVIIIIEYCGGGTLYSYYKQKGKVSEKNIAIIIRAIVEALFEMHTNGFVHRDLKLENVMVQSQDPLLIKLVDFGFSERINEEELLNKSGTPGFLPPEIFKSQPYTAKGDIFSTGVILYIMASGYAPFRGRPSQIQLLNSKCEINFDKHPWPEISFDLRTLAKKMLEQKVQNRYSSLEVLESTFIQHHTKLTSETNYKSFQMLSGLEIEKNPKQPRSVKYSDSSESKNSKEFRLDFSIHTNDIKSLYQKNSIKTVQSHRSKKQSLNKSQKLKQSISSPKEMEIEKYQQKRMQSHPDGSSCHNSQILNSSFGELIKQRSMRIVLTTFIDVHALNHQQKQFLRQSGNVFNKPKRPTD